jgi:hypothetical protein
MPRDIALALVIARALALLNGEVLLDLAVQLSGGDRDREAHLGALAREGAGRTAALRPGIEHRRT